MPYGAAPTAVGGPPGRGYWQSTDGQWYPPQPRKFYKRVWFWLLVIVVLGLGGCISIVSLAGNAINTVNNTKHTVVYTVTGNGTGDITYASFSGTNSGSAAVNGATLPWSKTFTATGIFTGFDVSVTGDSATQVSCTITVDGKQVAHNTGSGQYASADCSD
jgi:uncharacterized protein YceK